MIGATLAYDVAAFAVIALLVLLTVACAGLATAVVASMIRQTLARARSAHSCSSPPGEHR